MTINRECVLLLLDDEPLILMDLEFAAEDLGCKVFAASSLNQGLELLRENGQTIEAAVLDVTLQDGDTCLPLARKLEEADIPYIIHSGDLDRHDEQIRALDAPLIAKPASATKVIEAAKARRKT